MAARYRATLERVLEHNPRTRSLFLRLPAGQRLAFTPGQFISCSLPVGEGGPIVRPYSIASSPEQGELLEICVDLVPGGPGSHYLFNLAPGAAVEFTGPWGTFTLERVPEAECVFVAERSSVAPIRPMIWRALATDATHPLRLLHAAPTDGELVYKAEFEKAARDRHRLSYVPIVGGLIFEEVKRLYVDGDADRSRHFYICGVGDIVNRLRDLLRQAGYERRAVHYEKW